MFGGNGPSPSDYYNMLVRGSLPDTSARGGGEASSNPISRPPASTTSVPPTGTTSVPPTGTTSVTPTGTTSRPPANAMWPASTTSRPPASSIWSSASTISVLTSTTSMPPIREDQAEEDNNTNPAPPESGGHKEKDPSFEYSNDSEDIDVDVDEAEEWKDARDSRSNCWNVIRCILPHPEEGSAIEEHKLWVYVFRTAAEAILFSTYDQNPRVLNAMCEMVDSLLDGEPVDPEDFDDYRRAEGAALDLYGVPFDAEAYRRLGYVESDEIDDSVKDIWNKFKD
ncbi:hypothetical protein CPLU01_12255 [Colletotrichum plurivorum]|uniref:Uncharacterized protein n=1 Tax=Colletotrichum plurivorum TaxID=2175906 RepID=A0A8H6K0B1_9PEZI|nr:hypothetical protein CPLU01_12255 [Colletotrichum plurivorum]